MAVLLMALASAQAGVDKSTQERYKRRYENRTFFLKIPVRGDRQIIAIGSGDETMTLANEGNPLRFKVGDQVSVLNLNFGRNEVRFKIASVETNRQSELVFRFPSELTESFSESSGLDAALNKIFTEGLTYKEIDNAKQSYLKDQFDKIISDLAIASNTSRDFVLQSIAQKLPACEAAKKDVENVTQRNRELSEQVRQLTAQLERMELERKQLQDEIRRLKQ